MRLERRFCLFSCMVDQKILFLIIRMHKHTPSHIDVYTTCSTAYRLIVGIFMNSTLYNSYQKRKIFMDCL